MSPQVLSGRNSAELNSEYQSFYEKAAEGEKPEESNNNITQQQKKSVTKLKNSKQ